MSMFPHIPAFGIFNKPLPEVMGIFAETAVSRLQEKFHHAIESASEVERPSEQEDMDIHLSTSHSKVLEKEVQKKIDETRKEEVAKALEKTKLEKSEIDTHLSTPHSKPSEKEVEKQIDKARKEEDKVKTEDIDTHLSTPLEKEVQKKIDERRKEEAAKALEKTASEKAKPEKKSRRRHHHHHHRHGHHKKRYK